MWGSIEAAAENLDEIRKLSLEHVQRSRQEPRCISHSVQADLENSLRLVFYEEWEDMAALQVHFNVAESGLFLEQLSRLAACPPAMKIFESRQVG